MDEAVEVKSDIPLLDRKEELHSHKGYWFLRRSQDILFSGLALIVLLPFMLVVALIVFLDDPHGSPIFSQVRCGRNGKQFKMYKFRSMYVNAEQRLDDLLKDNEMDGPAFKIKEDPRITRVGKFIRKTSIDELPQLWNVLTGRMSIVGPRPSLPREVEHYRDEWKQRMYVTPGLTCYWQIAPSRNDISFEDWMALDLKYIKERSFLVDWKIIFKTFAAVLRKQGE
jgi:lipopolysaccharide/colanic/teichoic acid biosynthesis glycosyltransferase